MSAPAERFGLGEEPKHVSGSFAVRLIFVEEFRINQPLLH